MGTFTDKVAIVTGAGSGIGKALAFELARRGAHVVVSDLSPERAMEVGKAVQNKWGKGTWLKLDVTDFNAVKQLIDDTVSEHGRLDYMFNNAGIVIGGAAKDVTIDDWLKVIDVDLMGVVYGATVAYKIMAKQGFGHIVNTASIEGLVPHPVSSSYSTCKFGVVGLSGALRIEGADMGVKVSVVCPGYIKTPIYTDSKMVNLDRDKMMTTLPDWIGITPEECAKRILWGVERNKAYIVVTWFAKILWAINRISPNLTIVLMKQIYRHLQKKGIIS